MLVIGGGSADPQALQVSTPATNTVEILDLGEQLPAWRFTASMAAPRVMPDATLLPDGTVLVTGGSATGRSDMGIDPVLLVEQFDATTESWTQLASMHTPRSYHSTSILLPSGKVLIGGKDFLFNLPPYDYPEHRLEVFSPPYLFRGPQRPVRRAGGRRLDTAFTVQASHPIHTAVLSIEPVTLVRPPTIDTNIIELFVNSPVTTYLSIIRPTIICRTTTWQRRGRAFVTNATS